MNYKNLGGNQGIVYIDPLREPFYPPTIYKGGQMTPYKGSMANTGILPLLMSSLTLGTSPSISH